MKLPDDRIDSYRIAGSPQFNVMDSRNETFGIQLALICIELLVLPSYDPSETGIVEIQHVVDSLEKNRICSNTRSNRKVDQGCRGVDQFSRLGSFIETSAFKTIEPVNL